MYIMVCVYINFVEMKVIAHLIYYYDNSSYVFY